MHTQLIAPDAARRADTDLLADRVAPLFSVATMADRVMSAYQAGGLGRRSRGKSLSIPPARSNA